MEESGTVRRKQKSADLPKSQYKDCLKLPQIAAAQSASDQIVSHWCSSAEYVRESLSETNYVEQPAFDV